MLNKKYSRVNIIWKDTITSIIIYNIETVEIFKDYSGNKKLIIENICSYVVQIINKQPLFFRIPIKILSGTLKLFSWLISGKKLSLWKKSRRRKFIELFSKLPFVPLLNKLVRNLMFIKFFDLINMPERLSILNKN